MTTAPAQFIQACSPTRAIWPRVKSVTTPDVTYVSLNETTRSSSAICPGPDNTGPRPSCAPSKNLAGLETKAFEVREVLNRAISRDVRFRSPMRAPVRPGDHSPFSLLAKVRDGKIHYIPFLEDTFGYLRNLGRPRSLTRMEER